MLQLQLQPQTEERLRRILAQYSDLELFAQNIIAYQIAELKKAILNIRLDLHQFEQKYQQSTETFYQQFTTGKLDDSEDFLIWAGIYEMLQDNKRQLEAIK
ncbi:MAG: hypothetical protein DRQ49_18620 [Gammaproteobacteria bacterium]|nr:MAG: hypothetical protein DRQ49_18620 [Gammaproteobacteria bacterium]RKZ43663.1 MAG: hypothetical protein DRQ41_04740 [Gammaproteobacteria bacterium]RKZ75762.1 MAG: hypothetical protein DRQ57_06320 [Gammaproteobacteria bacterium]